MEIHQEDMVYWTKWAKRFPDGMVPSAAFLKIIEERDAWMDLCGQVQEWYTAYRRRNPEDREGV